MRARLFFLALLLVSAIGCTASDRYRDCMADASCAAEVDRVRQSSFTVSKAAASSLPMPGLPDVIGYVVSNAAAFGVGVWKGKRKKVS